MPWRSLITGGPTSGPAVARLFHRLFGVIAFIAWASLAVQVRTLIGSHGLLPIAGVAVPSLPAYPSIFRWLPPTDTLLVAGAWLGAGLGLIAAGGLAPRVIAGVHLVLYLGYVCACRDFLSFQWDNLFLETAMLAMLLPRDRPSRLAHLLFRVLLFKLYFESGIAKWQSNLHDWHDGSAMTWYYETAPLPTCLAWWAHHLPVWWHHFESRATLFVELAMPLAIFGSRPLRLAAFATLTAFQLVNLATANYGFFVYLALALHVFLLDDRLLRRPDPPPPSPPRRWRRAAMLAFLVVYLALSIAEALIAFSGDGGRIARAAQPLRRFYAPLRVIDTYHLFGSITRVRTEVDFLTSTDGGKSFTSQPLHWKPGPPDRAPPFVAPHQPRVDFLLWFYGLDYRGGAPDYVVSLVEHLCHDPRAVQPLFVQPLPPAPTHVQLRFADYTFSSPAEKATGLWWHVEPREGTDPIACDELRER